MEVTRSAGFVGAIDQGTSSSRFLIFSSETEDIVARHQVELFQQFPQDGWVEMDPVKMIDSVVACMDGAARQFIDKGYNLADIKGIGITNQRETAIAWDRFTGKPLCNAIVWLDQRTAGMAEEFIQKTGSKSRDALRAKCGLPIHAYFSALKFRWMIDNVPAVAKAYDEHRCLFGTVDCWVIWNLTGGIKGGNHLTDVTNACRTMLMNLDTLSWDPDLCNFFGIDSQFLPKIRSCSQTYGSVKQGLLKAVPICGCIGDQQGALVGQRCFSPGSAKNTYGTGCFLLYNTGETAVQSHHGLLTTVGYQLGDGAQPVYALEGSIAVGGAVVRWLRDNLEFIENSADVEALAESVKSTDVYLVPAFSGLYAPHWDSSARGIITGLSQYSTKAHIARAALESVCFQTKDVVDAMMLDGAVPLKELQCDGGMSANPIVMQTQSDILGVPVRRALNFETTALGAAIVAGLACDLWSMETVQSRERTMINFSPEIGEVNRNERVKMWNKAVERSKSWISDKDVSSPDKSSHWKWWPACLKCALGKFGLYFGMGILSGMTILKLVSLSK